jgi:hypothetical protein
MDGLLEVRSTNRAFEMRFGQIVEFASDFAGQTRRLRSLGCPEHMIKGVIAKRNQEPRKRTTPQQFTTLRAAEIAYLGYNSKEVARLARLNAERCRKPKLSQAERIARVTDAVRVDRINMSTEQTRQYKADEELRERMQNLAGITNRDKTYQPQ